MNKLRIIGGILISAVLALSSGGAVLSDSGETTPPLEAAAQSEQQYQGLFGTVTVIDGDVITLETKNLGEVEVLLTEVEIYKVPGQEEASKENIKVGSRLAILATPNEDDSYNAIRVMVVPEVATRQHINGVIVSIEDKVMTIINANGETMTVDVPDGIKGGVVGDFVSIAVRKSLGEGNPEASGLQTAVEVQARIQTHLHAMAGSGAGTKMQQLSDQLEALALRIRGVLEDVAAEAPEAAMESIQNAIGNAEQGIERARQAINQAQGAAAEQQSGKPTTAPGR